MTVTLTVWRQAGLQVAAWTVDAPEEGARLRALGVRYLITNRPGALREGLARAGA